MTFSVRQMDVMKFNIFSDLLGLYIYIYYIYIYPKKPKCKQANVVDDDDEEVQKKHVDKAKKCLNVELKNGKDTTKTATYKEKLDYEVGKNLEKFYHK